MGWFPQFPPIYNHHWLPGISTPRTHSSCQVVSWKKNPNFGVVKSVLVLVGVGQLFGKEDDFVTVKFPCVNLKQILCSMVQVLYYHLDVSCGPWKTVVFMCSLHCLSENIRRHLRFVIFQVVSHGLHDPRGPMNFSHRKNLQAASRSHRST